MTQEKQKPELLIDSNRGIYIPNHFYNYFDFDKFNLLDKAEYDELADPHHEHYWEAWEDLLNEAITDDNRVLYQDGDLWLVPEGFDPDTDFE